MKKAIMILVTLSMMVSMVGTAAAGARGYGLVFILMQTVDRQGTLSLPDQANRN